MEILQRLYGHIENHFVGEGELPIPHVWLQPHSVSIMEFIVSTDGKTPNTHAFEFAIFYLHSYVDKGSVCLHIPRYKWMTRSKSFIKHLTLFME
jgi:hypothetical protein